jgi:hypothetical protein
MGKNIPDPDDLKILIVSTPKTGNTWVRHLLANVYRLPLVQVGASFDAAEVDALGQRWITHQHYKVAPDIIDYGRRNGVTFVTTIRHPGDALVSKFHFVRNLYDSSTWPASDPSLEMLHDGETIGEHTLAHVQHGFADYLDTSLGWIRSGESHVVRYEDLWRDPVAALQELTSSIHQVSLERIEQSIEACDFDLMRAMSKSNFFRKGTVGDWKQALPPEIIDALRCTDPYPAQFAALGYTLEPDDPLTTLPRKPRVSKNPFHGVTHFDNDVPVPPIVALCYVSLDPALRDRWPDVKQTTEGSFYAWLNAPADRDPRQGESLPIVTNLADCLYGIRADLRETFPDVFGQDRSRYVAWWLNSDAQTTYHLDPAFGRDAWHSWLEWCDMPAGQDPHPPGTAPLLTNLAAHIYHVRPDLQEAFPDLYGEDRSRFAHWFITNAQTEYAADEVLFEPVRSSVRIISQGIPELFAFSLRHKLSAWVRKVCAWVRSNGRASFRDDA